MSPFASSPVRLLTPLDSVRLSLMQSLHHAHRPELADLVETADLVLDLPGVWLRPADAFAGVSAALLEPALLEAITEAGLPLSWIRVLGTHSFAAA